MTIRYDDDGALMYEYVITVRVTVADYSAADAETGMRDRLNDVRDWYLKEPEIIVEHVRDAASSPAMPSAGELADEFVSWVEAYTMKVCPEGCLPTPGQEREIRMFAAITRALRSD